MTKEPGVLTARVVSWPAVATIGLTALASAAVIWLIAVPFGPEVCALSLPGPRNCFTSQRIQAAFLPTLAIMAIAVLSIAVTLVRPRISRFVSFVAVLLLLAMTVIAYVLVAWIPALPWSGLSGVNP
ncbi:hypothetical protein NQ156_04815 [Microbacterium sp. zg.Y625]|uniref:hypothetical protein n=1 Tax=Microbacterium jiangjiandongii TaxID=3049071 RepID=UPI00214AC68D|nr:MULTISPECIES: hypothetical protein [unclassified Microbacterium]MCR2792380.1 hypothetical protein [Microbacterium sp. zg.Y625]MCR2816868.1 hypothetical protein [Microbacterium sp. zg.Y843]WIM26378.1 hypothetical protein QNO14_04840 [Microbacterium sp. zg-Y625]